MRKIIISVIIIITITLVKNLQAQIKIETNQLIRLSDTNTVIYVDNEGKYNSAAGYQFDHNSNGLGLGIENGNQTSTGIFLSPNSVILWNSIYGFPLVRFFNMQYGEVDQQEKAFINDQGYYFTNSDSNRKKNIKKMDSSLFKIDLLKGVTYKHKAAPGDTLNQLNDKVYFGLLAQDVEKVVPQAVFTDSYGNKFLNYESMIPLLIEAIKEQQILINQQNTIINSLLNDVDDLKKKK